jgi:choline dehydrogenase-like flavoprotein
MRCSMCEENRWDYDHWASLGNPGWSYDDVLPLFKRAENNEEFKDDFHGQGGPLNVTYPRHQSPLTNLFLEAAALHQIRPNPDYNGAEQEGAFKYQVTHKGGERWSAAKAYITPNLSRENLSVHSASTARLSSMRPARLIRSVWWRHRRKIQILRPRSAGSKRGAKQYRQHQGAQRPTEFRVAAKGDQVALRHRHGNATQHAGPAH